MAFSRAGVSAGLHATDIAAIRFAIAGLAMLPWLLRNRKIAMEGLSLPRAIVLSTLAGPLFIIIVGGSVRSLPDFQPLGKKRILSKAT